MHEFSSILGNKYMDPIGLTDLQGDNINLAFSSEKYRATRLAIMQSNKIHKV